MLIRSLYGRRMYIAKVPNRNSPPAILIRESYREGGKPKKRTVANISKWKPTRIEALRQLLKGNVDLGEAQQFEITANLTDMLRSCWERCAKLASSESSIAASAESVTSWWR